MSVNISHSSSDENNFYHLNETNNTEGIPHPALLNQIIIESIFEKLDNDDFRNCRLVCQKWKSVGDLAFKKKVRLCLHFKTNEDGVVIVEDRTKANLPAPTNLMHFFRMSQLEFPFRAVSFKNRLPWSPAELSNFFSTQGRFITDLTLWNVALKSDDYNKEKETLLENFDLTESLTRLNLRKLTLKREEDLAANTTRLIIAFKNLENIQHINLERCSIVLNNIPLIIAPIELSLTDVIFERNSKPLENTILNEVVNFDLMKKLSLIFGGSRNTILNEVSLDVSGSTILDQAQFLCINLINFIESGWNIGDLEWGFQQFDKSTKMTIKQLRIIFCKCALKMLPNSLEKLSIGGSVHFVESTEPNPWNICRPYIKRLQLTEIEAIQSCWLHLTHWFPNLEYLQIKSWRPNVTMDLRMIPSTVTQFALQGRYQFFGDGVHALNELRMDFDDRDMDSISHNLWIFEPQCYRLWKFLLNFKDPFVKALFETSIPQVQLDIFGPEELSYLKRTFANIDNGTKWGVMMNKKCSTITIRLLQD